MPSILLCLYTAPACTLCDIAEEEVYRAMASGDYQLQKVDITADTELKKRYGLRIPVLSAVDPASKRELWELAWPFSVEDIIRMSAKSG